MESIKHCCSTTSATNCTISDMECISDKKFNNLETEKMDIDERENDDIETLKPPSSLADLIEGLHKIFAHDKVNVEFVKTYMGMYKSNYKDWKRFAKWDVHRFVFDFIISYHDILFHYCQFPGIL